MGLASDIEQAFLDTMGNPEEVGNVPELAQGIADAVINLISFSFVVTCSIILK